MLATLEHTLPVGEQWRYEATFDGFRGLLWHEPKPTVQVLSRNMRDLASASRVGAEIQLKY